MTITSKLISSYASQLDYQAEESKGENKEANKATELRDSFRRRLIKQSKRISQIIVQSWMDGDENKCIREIFLNFHLVINESVSQGSGTKEDPLVTDNPRKLMKALLIGEKITCDITMKTQDKDTELVYKFALNDLNYKYTINVPYSIKTTSSRVTLEEVKVLDDKEFDEYIIHIDWNSFEGSVRDYYKPGTNQKPPYFVMSLPYPPRTSEAISALNTEVVKEWLKNKPDINDIKSDNNAENPFPPHPYLPQTST